MNLNTRIPLGDGESMPLFGLGTWLSQGGECKKACLAALKRGVRHIDTAAMYENEEEVGEAIRESGIPRDEIFVTSKLMPADHGKVKEALMTTLRKLGLESVDLYLIHSPSGGSLIKTWDAMLECKAQGLAKSVGVSNFGAKQLAALRDLEPKREQPAANQIELHVWLQQRETVEYCAKNGVTVIGYCPLARCKQFGETPVAEIAKRLGRPEADVAIRWSLQMGYATIPKTVTPARIDSNASCVDGGWELAAEDMAELAKCDCGFKASNSVNNMDTPFEQVA